MHYRFASLEDAAVLASLNQQLTRDEGHRKSTDLAQLTERMAAWLRTRYQAVMFEENGSPVGCALFRREREHVYLRQLVVVSERRRQEIRRNALLWLWHNAWPDVPRLRIEVLVGDAAGREFWRRIGFKEYLYHRGDGTTPLMGNLSVEPPESVGKGLDRRV